MEDGGQRLKAARERLNLRYRDVEEASVRLANRHKNDDYSLALSRLADIENKGSVPSIFRLYALCAIYRLDLLEALRWFGVDISQLPGDAVYAGSVERTHPIKHEANGQGSVQVPLALDPGLDPRRTTFLSRMIQRWGSLPLMLLNGLEPKERCYAFVGTEDWFMYPLLRPGSLVIIDERRRRPEKGPWTTEFERPIYFCEHRDGFSVSWCSVNNDKMYLLPHPASASEPLVFEYPREIEPLGQVIAVAMSLDPVRGRRIRS